MASPKIKRKGSTVKASAVPRQGAVPCLIIVALVLVVLGVILYFSLRGAA